MYNFDNKGKRLHESRLQRWGENTWKISIHVHLSTTSESEGLNITWLFPALPTNSIPTSARIWTIVKEGCINSDTPSSMESSNIGMICNFYGNTLTPYSRSRPTNVLSFSPKLIWILSKIVKKCLKYFFKSFKPLRSLWLFKEYSHCMFEFM